MNGYAYQVALFFKRLVFALLLLALSRFYFYLLNYDLFSATPWQIIKSFLGGIRFDFYVFVILGGLFVVLSLLAPAKLHNALAWQKLLKGLFVLILTILLFFNFIDVQYFPFTHKRLSFNFFSFVTTGNDVVNLLPAFLKNYWYSLLVFLLMIWLSARYYPVSCRCFRKTNRWHWSHSVGGLFLLGILFVAARGTGYRPLSIIDAASYEVETMDLTLNTPFTIMATYGKPTLETTHYFTKEKALHYFSPIHHYDYKQPRKKNVVIIILESFGQEYIGFYNHGKGYTPFLDSLLSQSLTFTYSMSNSNCSIEGIPAVVASIPNISATPFILSPYAINRITSLASELKTKGYYSAFFHGGRNGTMGFDKFARLAQYDAYFGLNEYEAEDGDSDYDGHWGIYDEPYLQYFSKTLSSFKQPFLATLFTLSSHHPFTLPKQYKGCFPKGTLPIHKTVAYTDYALRRFFESAKQTSWYENTLFVLVADHTSLSNTPYYETRKGSMEILLTYFSPGDTTLKGKKQLITQQIDIMPSVLDYLHYNKPFFAFGKSIFREPEKHWAVSYVNYLYQGLAYQYFEVFDGKQLTNLYAYKTDSLLKHNLADSIIPSHLDTLKAFIQIASEAMVRNKMRYDTYE